MKQQRIIDLANQIAKNQVAYPQEQRAKRVARHIKMFWEERMVEALLNIPQEDNHQLHEEAVKAVYLIKSGAEVT